MHEWFYANITETNYPLISTPICRFTIEQHNDKSRNPMLLYMYPVYDNSPLPNVINNASPLTVLVLGPPQGPRALSTPGAPPCVPPGGVGRPLLGLGRSAPPRVVGVRRPMPAVRSLCPAALRPLGLASRPQSPQRARPHPPQARGLCPPPGRPPCVPPGGVGRPLLGLGRSAPPQVVGACRPMPS
jgi:hypothetical protein